MTMQTAHTVVSDGYSRIAPEGWVFVTNDPEVVKAPQRVVSILNREKKTVLIIDTRIETFIIRDLTELKDVHGSYYSHEPRAPWRIGNTPFADLGDIGRAVGAVLTRHGDKIEHTHV